MKNSLKYLLIAAIAGFLFLNISGKVDKRKSVQAMPEIPNGGFEDQPNKAWEIKIDNGEEMEGAAHFTGERIRKTYNINIDTVKAYRGKFCAVLGPGCDALCNTWLDNKFPISVHPSVLHAYVKTNFYNKTDRLDIKVDLLKGGLVVDSGVKVIMSSIRKWTEIIIPISNKTTEADSARIEVSTTFISTADRAWVDDLFFK